MMVNREDRIMLARPPVPGRWCYLMRAPEESLAWYTDAEGAPV